MSSKTDLRQTLLDFIGDALKGKNYYSKVGTVVSVDKVVKTCEVSFADGTPNTEPLLQQSETDTGLLLVPVVGKPVVVSYKSTENSFISMFSDIEEVIFQDGANEGIVKVIELTDKLNNLENDINTLKTVFATTWVVVAQDGGAALKAAAATWAGSTLTPTIKSEIQNNKFIH